MLEIDSRAEQDTIKNYVERIIQTQSAGEFGLEKNEILSRRSRRYFLRETHTYTKKG
jgi:hypothetical protein